MHELGYKYPGDGTVDNLPLAYVIRLQQAQEVKADLIEQRRNNRDRSGLSKTERKWFDRFVQSRGLEDDDD